MYRVAVMKKAGQRLLDTWPGLAQDKRFVVEPICAGCAAAMDRLMKKPADLMLVDLRSKGITGKEAQHKLDEVYITANKNGIPFDPEKPTITSGLRLGTPSVTTRGMKEDDMVEIAELISLTLEDFESNKEIVRRRVKDLTSKYPLY